MLLGGLASRGTSHFVVLYIQKQSSELLTLIWLDFKTWDIWTPYQITSLFLVFFFSDVKAITVRSS